MVRLSQARNLGVSQRRWRHNDRPLLEGRAPSSFWPSRLREEVSRIPTLRHCNGACVSQATAHPVTFQWNKKGEGYVQQAGGWNSSHQVQREKLEGKELGGKTGTLERRTLERMQGINYAL